MRIAKIILDENVVEYLNKLVYILYNEEYFGLKESAYDYAGWIFDNIKQNLPNVPHKLAPKHFEKYGRDLYYSVFKKNNNTQWYVFFNREDNVYYVRHIGNNHTCAQYLD